MGEVFKFAHENAGLEALHHHHGELKQLKIGLPLALSELPKQNFFQMITRVIWFVADIHCVQDVSKDLLGQAGQSIGLPEFLWFGACLGELCLDEAKPDGRFLLIVGVKLDLRGRCCRDGLIIVSFCHVVRENKEGAAQAVSGIVPEKEWGSHCEKKQRKTNGWQEQTNKMERCTNRVQQIWFLSCRFQSKIYVKKMFKRNVVALGLYTAKLAINTKRGRKRKRLALCMARACERKLYS
jgi:hypothetical protein